MRPRTRSLAVLSATCLALGGLVAGAPAALGADGGEAELVEADWHVLSFADDGTVAAFQGADQQLYARDLTTGTTTLVSATADGTPAAGFHRSRGAVVSRNGRYVVFSTHATNLHPSDTDVNEDVYVKDLATGSLTLASTSSTGEKGNLPSFAPSRVSDDGRVLVFASRAGNFPPLVPLPPGCPQPEDNSCVEIEVYAKDLGTGALTLLTLGDRTDFEDPVSSSVVGDVSADGSVVAVNVGDPLTPDDQDVWKFPDVFLVDLATGQRTLASSQDPTGFSSFYAPSLSEDGTRVAFVGDLAGGPFLEEVFVRDAADALPLRASTSAAGVVANGIAISPRLAGDGLSVAFTSRASNLHPDDTDTADDVVLKDLTTGEVHLATLGDAKPAGAFGGSSPLLALGGVGGVLFSAPLALYDPAVTDPYAFGVFRRTFAPSGPVDADGDGVVDALQPAGTAAGAFVDASTVPATSGAVVDTGGLAVAVTDAEDPAEGVLVTVGPAGPGTTRATLSVCGLTVRLDAGSSAVLTCGSLVVRTLTGTVRVETDGGAVVVTVPAGASARVVDTAAGADVDEVSGTGVTVTVGGSTTALADGSGGSFVTWTVSGPGAPVDPQPVLNRVKAGRAVPLKWHVADASGAPVTTLTSASVSVRNLACGLATTTDEVEQTVAGGSGLQNLGGGYYQLNWKTSPAWTGSCKTMTLDLGGGAVLRADFQLSR